MKDKDINSMYKKKSCCFARELFKIDNLAKYGSIFVVIVSILVQSYNVIFQEDYLLSYISLFFNLFFLVVVFTKLKIIKIDFLNPYIDFFLRFLIFIFFLNFISYLFFVDSFIYRYLYAPIFFIGAYFVFLLLKNEDTI